MTTQLSALKRSQTFLWIMIFTFVTVIIWVGLTLFRTQRETGISPELLRHAEPLNPNIDIELLNRIGQKRRFSAEEVGNFPIYLFTVTRTGEQKTIKFNTDQAPPPPSTDAPESISSPSTPQEVESNLPPALENITTVPFSVTSPSGEPVNPTP